MSSVSQFLGAANLPIGATIPVSPSVTQDLITQGSMEYLRTGKLVPYQSKYATARSVGLGINRWPVPNINQNGHSGNINTSQREDTLTYAMGTYGRLSRVSINMMSFVGRNGTGFNSPVNILLPWANVYDTSFLRSTLQYVHSLNLWVAVECASSSNSPTVYASKDGYNWYSLNFASTSASGIATVNITTTNNNAFVFATNGSGTTYVHRISFSFPDSARISITNSLVYTWANTFTGGGASGNASICPFPNQSALWITGTPTTTSDLVVIENTLPDNGGSYALNSTAGSQGGSVPILWAINPTTGRIVIVRPCQGGTYSLYSGVSLRTLSTPGGMTFTGSSSTNSANARLQWTGAYFVLYHSPADVHTISYSSDGVNWTNFTGTPAVNGYSNVYVSTFRNHVLADISGGSRVLQLASGTYSGTVGPTNSFLGFGYAIHGVLFNSNYVVLHEQSVATQSASDYYEDLRWWNSANSSPINSMSRLKVVNGVLFIINTVGNTILYSTDGLNWALSSAVGNLTSIYDIEYFGGNYVVVGVGSSVSNCYYGTTLTGSWAAQVINAFGTAIQQLLNTGSALVALSTAISPRRTTNITGAWNTIATLAVTPPGSVNGYVEGGIAYVYLNSGTPSTLKQYVATDATAATWTTNDTGLRTYAISGGSLVNQVPHHISKFGSTYYCIMGIDNISDTGSELGLYTSTNLLSFTPLVAPVPSTISSDNTCSIFTDINGALVYSIGDSGYTEVGQTVRYQQKLVLEGNSAGYVGSTSALTNTFVRIA